MTAARRETPPPGRDTVRWIDERAGASPALKAALRYVFPEHWSFMLGEIALYAFVVLVGTGTFLALFFESSTSDTVYHGSYAPLAGARMSLAYASTLRLSQDVPAGRPLPQLPLAIDPATRELRANGGYSGSIGPAWLETDRGGA